MSGQAFEQQFRATAAFLVQMLDPAQDRALVTLISEADYREASFLDQRILSPEKPRQWLNWADLAGFAGDLPDTAELIFHIGHVGSTLISRLLGELPTVLAVREPLILRTFAELYPARACADAPWDPASFDQRLKATLGWLSRTFRPEQHAMIKATSFVNELAPALLGPERRSLFLYVAPETYLETTLAGDASRQEQSTLGGARLTRLHRRIGAQPWRLWQLSPGERAALAWACEMAALQQSHAEVSGAGILWVDFDRFLKEPGPALLRLAGHFGHPLDIETASALVAGPIMNRYSKAPEHGYSPRLRAEVLSGARSLYAEEIRRGLRWLDAAAGQHPLIGSAITRVSQEE